MMKNKNSKTKTALKFERLQIQKNEQNMSSDIITFRTHTLSKSEAEIILPPHYYNNVSNKNQDYIYLITSGKTSFYAQISESTIDKHLKEASILQNLVSIAGIVLDSSGTFKGEMKGIQKQKIPKTYELEYAQILVKNMYLSRRDQYKVLKTLKDRTIHVYNRKNLYFDKLKLEVTNLMHNNQQVRRTGVITKNTKIIFRSGCAKYTILVELSQEMFELNENKQLYLEKTIHFLLVFFQRNNFFNNKHRIEIILFARLFYPQFSSLKQAYQTLQTDENHGKGNVFTINYAVALQKDYQGRIYQDVYRRLLWPSGTVAGFREQFWERVSEFIFTINWADSETYAKNISQSVEQNVERQIFLRKTEELAFKIKPFLHRLPCKLAKSKQTCFFQAISMISQQYKHHYYFRSLSETGNAITVVSAGKSIYTVDTTTYKMAKSNVYLTNINLIHINLRRREPKIEVQIINMTKKPRYQNKEDIIKLQHLKDWCIEEDAYKSPTNMNIEFSEDFQLKSVIYPQNLRVMTEEEKRSFEYIHYCTKNMHYVNQEEDKDRKIAFTVKNKTIEWVSAYYINGRSYQVHDFFYDNSNFDTDLVKTKKKNKEQQTEFTTFERDLKVIINMKKNYNFSQITHESMQAKRLNNYIFQAARIVNENKASQQEETSKNYQDLDNLYQMKFINKFFQISCLVGDEQKGHHYRRIMSNSNVGESEITNFTSTPSLFSSLQGHRSKRKGSDAYDTQLQLSLSKSKQKKKTQFDKTVNIFDQTYKKKEYIPKSNIYRPDNKRNTHNKQRLKKNYRESNIHFMTTYYNETSMDYLTEFIRRPEPKTQDEKFIYQNFYIEREWKNIIFPPLTPIYTNYKANLQSDRMNSKYSNFGEMGVEEEICKHLMENFQIESENLNLSITMSKGHVHLLLSITAKDNISLFEAVNLEKQKQIVPNLLYRYLCYQQKDYRFGAKSLIFSDQNFYNKEDKKQQKKSVKLVMLHESIKGDINSFRQVIRMLGQKYRGIKFQLALSKDEQNYEVYQITINLVQDLKNKIYKSQKIDVIFDINYNPNNLYQIIVEWHYCCATYVNDFIQNVISVARKNKIITYLVSKNNAFNTRWTTATIGQIIFQSRFAMQILQQNIVLKKEWLWDRQGYYMDRNGEAFIRFNRQKYLIEWYDNTIDKTKWRKLEVENRFYETFFMKAAAYDFLGGIIDSFTNNNSRKSSLALST